MTNHLESLLKALLVPSERLQVENKKDADAFLKAFKKKKRIIFMKLNKDQITKIQVVSHYKNLINYLENYKKKRIENVITLTQKFMQEFHCSIDESDINIVDNSCGKKRPLNDNINDTPKKPKLNVVAEHHISISDANDESLDNEMIVEQEELDNLQPGPLISSTERFTNELAEEEETSIVANETFEIVEREAVSVVKSMDNSENEQLVFKKLKSIVSSGKVDKSMSGKLPFPRTVSSTNIQAMSSSKKSELKTPLAKQGVLYKSKFHNDPSSISKTKTSQTSSVQKKPVAEIRRQQDKLEEERQQRIREELQRKENQAKLASIRSLKNRFVAPRLQPATSSAKQLLGVPKTFPPKTLTTNLAKVNSIDKFPLTSSSAQKSFTLPPRPAQGIATVVRPQLDPETKCSNKSSVPGVIYASEFKTPFSKKRVTLLSLSCRKIIENHESVDLEDLQDVKTEDEDDECERRSNKPVPKWCNKTGGTLMNLVRYQSKHLDSSTIFRNPALVPIDIEAIFGTKTAVKNYLEEWGPL